MSEILNAPLGKNEELQQITVRFAGDSGDGIQLIGSEFSMATALARNDLGTFPDFPAEIRAPAGTLPGVSGFQIHFGSVEIHTPGDACDVLVVMNAAALRKNLPFLKSGGYIIANEDGFDKKNLKLAGFADGADPLGAISEEGKFKLTTLPVTKLTKEAISGLGLGTKEADRSKNMFVLGLVCWLFNRPLDSIEKFLRRKFSAQPNILEANRKVLLAGYAFGETAELFDTQYDIAEAHMPPGRYRSITGNSAVALGLLAAAEKANMTLFYGTYPITPASDILHELAKHKSLGAITYQAEDEIAAICAAIGAGYGGNLGVTASSGPGIDLKTEAMGLAVMLEQPLVIVNVQRAGPSTGMPTKTEQADLLQAFHGRHGEAPMPIIAAQSPADCFYAAFEACQIALEHMTPVMLLSDGYLANGTEPWQFPTPEELPDIKVQYAVPDPLESKYKPYQRDENLVRPLALPGIAGLENRIGGLEKEDLTGNISYDALNHEYMVNLRAERVKKINHRLGHATPDSGEDTGDVLVIGWGGTYGSIKTACAQLQREGYKVSHLHLRWINPLPENLSALLAGFQHILVAELNTGQLRQILRAEFLVPAVGYNKIQGQPFTVSELKSKILSLI